ncbi:hypothetical protein D9M72_550430 [compost metagenome]
MLGHPLKDLVQLADLAGQGHHQVLGGVELGPVALGGEVLQACGKRRNVDEWGVQRRVSCIGHVGLSYRLVPMRCVCPVLPAFNKRKRYWTPVMKQVYLARVPPFHSCSMNWQASDQTCSGCPEFGPQAGKQ